MPGDWIDTGGLRSGGWAISCIRSAVPPECVHEQPAVAQGVSVARLEAQRFLHVREGLVVPPHLRERATGERGTGWVRERAKGERNLVELGVGLRQGPS